MVDAGRGEAAEVKESADDTLTRVSAGGLHCASRTFYETQTPLAEALGGTHAPGARKFRFTPFRARSAA